MMSDREFSAGGVMARARDLALPVVAALLFGFVLIWGAGFAQGQMLHNAAHDGRHAFAFPCH